MLTISTLLLGLILQTPVPSPPQTAQPLATFRLQCVPTPAAPNTTFRWEQNAGPIDVPFSNPTGAITDVSFIEQGTYKVRCNVSRTGSPSTFGEWSIVIGASFVPETAPVSTFTVKVDQIPPPDTGDKIAPVITAVKYNGVAIAPNDTVVVPSTLAFPQSNGINVTATDNLGVTNAMMIVDGTKVHSIGTVGKAPAAFFLYWLDNPMPAGLHNAVIYVYDGRGNLAQFPFKFQK